MNHVGPEVLAHDAVPAMLTEPVHLLLEVGCDLFLHLLVVLDVVHALDQDFLYLLDIVLIHVGRLDVDF